VRRALALLGGALVIFVCARVGQGAERESRPPARHVELVIGATTTEADLLESSVRDMLASKGLAAEATRKQVVTTQDLAAAIAPPREATPSVARVLVDLTVPGQATLFLIDPRRGRVFVRRMALAHGLDAVARASLRFVVEQSIDAILEGRDIGMSREEFQRSVLPPAPLPPPPVETPPPPPPVPAGTDMRLAVGYEAMAMGSSQVQQAGKLEVAAYLGRVEVAAAARLALPLSVSGGGAEARLQTASLGLAAAWKLLTSGNLSLAAGVGAGFDLTHVAPAVTSAGLEAAAAFWAASPWLDPFVSLERCFGRLALALAVGAEIHPLDERYAITGGSQTVDVFVPWRVRPAAQLTLGYVF